METLIRNAIMEHLRVNNILTANQHGFIEGRSCLTNLLPTIEECSANLDKHIATDIIYLDYSKAFDIVPHTRLLHKVQSVGVVGDILRWIEDFLSQRKQRVIVQGSSSTWERVLSGVPQGSVLGPTLFLIFINDLPEKIYSKIQLFADDTKIFRHIQTEADAKALQDDLNMLGQWSSQWKLQFNVAKCQALRIGSHRSFSERPVYTLQGEELCNVEEQRDLGVLVDSQLSFEKHIKQCVKKAYRSWWIIRRTFGRLRPKMFNLLFKSYVRPHVEYCPQVWSPYKKGLIKMIENIQRKATKSVIGLHDLCYIDRLDHLHLPSLQDRRERGDLIEVHKIMNKLNDGNLDHLFRLRDDHRRHGDKRIFKPCFRTVKRGNSFTQRIINKWNKLPLQTKTAKSSLVFKRRYDKMTDTTGTS